MAWKSWSNFFLLIAAMNLALAVVPDNQWRTLDLLAIPLCLTGGVLARRTMI